MREGSLYTCIGPFNPQSDKAVSRIIIADFFPTMNIKVAEFGKLEGILSPEGAGKSSGASV